MFDSWYDLPPLLRVGLGVVLLGLAVVFFLGGVTIRVVVPIGVFGLVCILFCRAGHDDGGYNF
jgi:hypothetical protein